MMDAQRASKRRRIEHVTSKQVTQPILSKSPNATDIYDDIEGAHRTSTPPSKRSRPLGNLGANATKYTNDAIQSPATLATKPSVAKGMLDPLRNQRNDAASPIKTPSRLAASIGFFKQFRSPEKVAATSSQSTMKSLHLLPSANQSKTTNGIQVVQNGLHEEEEEEEESSEDEDQPQSPTRTAKKAVHSATSNGVHQSDPHSIMPKSLNISGDANQSESPTKQTGKTTHKTIEDEIKAVEEAARKQAEDDDDDAWNVSQRPKRSTAGVNGRLLDATSENVRSSAKKSRTPKDLSSSKPIKRTLPRPQDPSRANSASNDILRSTLDKNIDALKDTVVTHTGLTKSRGVVPKNDLVIGNGRMLARNSLQAVAVTLPPASPRRPAVVSDEPSIKVKPKRSVPDFSFNPVHLSVMQRLLRGKLTGKRPIPLTGIPEEYHKVSTLMKHTITAGESNSMLVIGSRGTGKSALVEQITREQAVEHPDDFLVVRLNGFIHTDDKIALRDIWKQLGREIEMDDGEHNIKNHADTLATLLALLSHTPEAAGDHAAQMTKSVIFIMDEFDLFTHHPRQTLLYNLFDIAQSRKAPIAVLGLTTRVDVVESLEKRVKSRFSHRYVHLGMPKSFDAFQAICTAAMSITDAELTVEERRVLGSLGKSSETAIVIDDKHLQPLEQWNILIEYVMDGPHMTQHLQKIYHRSKSVPEFLTTQLLAISMPKSIQTVRSGELLDYFEDVTSRSTLRSSDSSLDLLSALSLLQLALLVCAARLDAIFGSEVATFALVYDEYKNLTSKAKIQASATGAITQGASGRIVGKGVARDAWEGLIDYGLIFDDGRGNARVDVGLEEIGMSGVELGSWARWCKEI